MPRRLNVKRMVRHAAKDTPDEIHETFNMLDDDAQNALQKWLYHFAHDMKIKHPGHHKIDVSTDNSVLYSSEFARVTARIRLH
jgi:hypothetical protein